MPPIVAWPALVRSRLELLYHAKPSVILYQISRFGFFIQNRYRRVRYITLVNLLTAKEIATPRPGAHLRQERSGRRPRCCRSI